MWLECSPKKHFWFYAVITFVLLLVFVVAFKPLFFPKKGTTAPNFLHLFKIPAKNTAETTSPATTPAAAAIAPLLHLQRFTITDVGANFVLLFSLDGKSDNYELQQGATPSELILTLHNTALAENLMAPVASFANFKLEELPEAVKLTIILNPQIALTAVAASLENEQELKLVFTDESQTLNKSIKETAATSDAVHKTLVPPAPIENAKALYQEAMEQLKNRQHDRALTALVKAIKLAPDYTAARVSLVVLFMQDGAFQQAETLADEGLKNSPEELSLVTLKGRLFFLRGKTTDAIKILEAHLPPMADNPDYYALLAAFYQKAGQPMAAAQIYYQLTRLPQAKSVWWVGLGTSFELAGKRNAALVAYQKARQDFDLDPNLRAYVEDKISRKN